MSYRKDVINKIILLFDLTVISQLLAISQISQKFGPNQLICYGDKRFMEKICLIL